MNDYGLNEEQVRAIQAKSPTLVRASAGSGKTRCLIAKIRFILEQSKPESICAVTFTNKAANEMKERLKKHHDIKGMQVSTIHSMCVRIVNTFINLTPLKPRFSIYDDSDQLSLIRTIMKSRELPGRHNDMLSAISKAKSKQETESLEGEEKEVYETYQEILLKNNACDFDDLLIYADICLNNEKVKLYYSNLWHNILVDEFQDTSVLQFSIIKKLYDPYKTENLFIVADANQSIYSWRAARPDNIQDYVDTYKATICDLTYNYRSSSSIINYANKFLQFGKPMIPKTSMEGKVSFTAFENYDDEAEKIANACLKMGDFENTAILFRVNTRTIHFEKYFTMKKVPYKIVGALLFYKRRIVKDLLSYCKAAVNESDMESLLRIVNVPKRGFGAAKQEKLMMTGRFYLEECKADPRIAEFLDILRSIRNMKPYEAINEILYRTDYKGTLKETKEMILLESFLNIVYEFKTIDELILASTFIEEDSGHGVKLMSAHASKGLEFDRVFVVGVEHEVWPHKLSENPAEEKRLFYVACTRAKKWLNISYSKNRAYRGSIMPTGPSILLRVRPAFNI